MFVAADETWYVELQQQFTMHLSIGQLFCRCKVVGNVPSANMRNDQRNQVLES